MSNAVIAAKAAIPASRLLRTSNAVIAAKAAIQLLAFENVKPRHCHEGGNPASCPWESQTPSLLRKRQSSLLPLGMSNVVIAAKAAIQLLGLVGLPPSRERRIRVILIHRMAPCLPTEATAFDASA
jgi:hypothetical protein